MTTRRGPHNQTTVPVLDRHGQPLAPARPSRVRRWLESGHATKVWIKGIFAVQLHDLDAATAITGGFAFNMDPGETTGIAITRESPDGQHRTIVGAYEHQHRNKDIHRNLNDRRDCRRNRRCRLRRRPARFDNRANNSAEGWLPPSTASLVNDADTIVRTMLQLYPITEIRVEYLRFDTQLMQNPDIRGIEYQRGTLQGWQLRHYILHRDHWHCQYRDRAGTKTRPLTVDHVIPESRGGPLVAACQKCNTKKTNRSLADFLAKDPRTIRQDPKASRPVGDVGQHRAPEQRHARHAANPGKHRNTRHHQRWSQHRLHQTPTGHPGKSRQRRRWPGPPHRGQQPLRPGNGAETATPAYPTVRQLQRQRQSLQQALSRLQPATQSNAGLHHATRAQLWATPATRHPQRRHRPHPSQRTGPHWPRHRGPQRPQGEDQRPGPKRPDRDRGAVPSHTDRTRHPMVSITAHRHHRPSQSVKAAIRLPQPVSAQKHVNP